MTLCEVFHFYNSSNQIVSGNISLIKTSLCKGKSISGALKIVWMTLEEALQGRGGGGGGTQFACRNFKMFLVGILSRVHLAVGN